MKASEFGDRLLPARELPPIRLLEGDEFMLRPNGFGLALLIIMLLLNVLLLLFRLFKLKWFAFWLFWLPPLNLFIRPPPPPKLPKLFIIELLLLLLLKLAKFLVRLLLPLFEKLLPIELAKPAPICRPLGVGFDDDDEATPTVELVELVVPKLPNEKLPRPKLLLLLLFILAVLLLLFEVNTPPLLAAEPPFTPLDALDTFRLTDELFRPLLAFKPLGVMLVGFETKPSADCCCCCCAAAAAAAIAAGTLSRFGF